MSPLLSCFLKNSAHSVPITTKPSQYLYSVQIREGKYVALFYYYTYLNILQSLPLDIPLFSLNEVKFLIFFPNEKQS